MDSPSLVDLGFSGNHFTWTSGREGVALIRERYDQALVNATRLTDFQTLR